MAIAHTVTYRWSGSGSTTLSYSKIISYDGEENRDVTVPVSTADLEVSLTVAAADIKVIFLVSDYALKWATNAVFGGASGDEYELVADEPIVWTEDSQLTSPITADITSLHLTNESASNTPRMLLKLLIDATT